MGKSSKQPDPALVAAAQAQANQQTAQYNNNVNRINQNTPLGSSTWSLRPGADPKNPQPGDYIQDISLSTGQRELYDQGLAGSLRLGGVTELAGQRAADSLGAPIDTARVPQLQGAPDIVQNAQAGQGIQGSVGPGGPLTFGVDTNGLPSVGSNDYGAQRDQVVSALMSRIAPDQAAARERSDTALADRGIEVGSTAYGRSKDLLGRQENDQLQGALLAGSQEQSRLSDLARADRGALFGEGVVNANLNNATQGTQFNQGLASAGFGNAAQAQTFGQTSQRDAVINALLGRNATFNNQARTQGLAETTAERSAPLNEFNALRSGAQVTQPTFPSYYSSGQAQTNGITDAYTAAGNQAAQNNASSNATYAAVGTAALTALSYY